MRPHTNLSKPALAPAIALFFTAPLVAEYLLGDLPITILPALIVLAPLYGCGALLIREIVRRAGRGWPSIIVLGMAYAIFEEAFTTQSLFNPNYLHLNMHLLDPAYIPSLGISAWWTLWMLNVHAAWSIATPIALIEACVPNRAATPWLGRAGMLVTAVLFVLGAVGNALISIKHDHYFASPLQFTSAALACIALIAIALWLPRKAERPQTGVAPNPIFTGIFALVFASVCLILPKSWGWLAFAAMLACDFVVIVAVRLWSRSTSWNLRHVLALASGAALAYGWHSFLQPSVVPASHAAVLASHVIFTLAAICLVWFAARRTSAYPRPAYPNPQSQSCGGY